MTLIAFIIGLVVPGVIGWLMTDLLEWKTPILDRWEKGILGYVFGVPLTMFCAFFGNVLLGIPFTLMGFMRVFGVMIVGLGTIWFFRKSGRHRVTPLPHIEWSRPATIALSVAGGWVALRIIALSIMTLATPPFFDDTMDNWNLRGKIFYYGKTFTLQFPWNENPGVSSYPPTVPLMKTWLSTIAGDWNEPLVNSIHVVWYLALLALLFCVLRRTLPLVWTILGTLLFASLPLELIQGTNAYADVFLSAHIFAAISLLFLGLKDRTHTPAFLRLSAFAIALVPFTKNEGWALYFPVLLFLFGASLIWIWKKKFLTRKELLNTAVISAVLIVLLVAPWIAFKMVNGLAFGNAKGIDLNLAWQPGVLQAIGVNTFLEGNWGFLFPLFFGLLIVRWRTAFRSPLLLLSALFLIPYLTQLFAYLTTGLSQEALFQTGYARGLIHLMPVIVILTTILLYDLITCRPTQHSSATNHI